MLGPTSRCYLLYLPTSNGNALSLPRGNHTFVVLMCHTLGCEGWVAGQKWRANAPIIKLNVIGCSFCSQRLHVVVHMWGDVEQHVADTSHVIEPGRATPL